MCCCVVCVLCGRGGRGGYVESNFFEFTTVTFSALGKNHTVSTRERTKVYVCGVCVVKVVRVVCCTLCDAHCVVLCGVRVLCVVCGMRWCAVLCGVVWRLPIWKKKKKKMQNSRFGDLSCACRLILTDNLLFGWWRSSPFTATQEIRSKISDETFDGRGTFDLENAFP